MTLVEAHPLRTSRGTEPFESPGVRSCVRREMADEGWPIVKTSAKTGAGVEEAFNRLARWMLER